MDNLNKLNNSTIQANIDVKGYVFKVLSYWKLFFVTIVIALIVAKFMNDYKTKVYNLNTVISVKEENNPLFSTGTNIAFNWGGASDAVETIKVVLTSRTHNEKVVRKLNFFINYLKEGRYRLEDVYGYTPFVVDLDTSKPQLYGQLIQVEITGEDTYNLSFDLKESNSNALIIYDSNTTSIHNFSSPLFSKEYKIGEQINTEFLNFSLQKTKKFTVGEKFYIQFVSFDGTVGSNRSISVAGIANGASMLSLSKGGPNKNRIVDYLNATVVILDEDKQEQKILYAKKTKDYIELLFTQLEDSLQRIEKELGVFKEKNNIYNLSEEGSLVFNETITIEQDKKNILEFNDYLNNLRSYLLSHDTYGENIPVPALIAVQDGKISGEITTLIQLSSLREKLRGSVTDNHPQVIKLSNDINISKTNLLENISTLKVVNQNKINKL